MYPEHEERLARARVSLEGLSVADACGGFFEGSHPDKLPYYVKTRQLPPTPWHFTDDTNMALSIYSILRQYGEINQDTLAISFAVRPPSSKSRQKNAIQTCTFTARRIARS